MTSNPASGDLVTELTTLALDTDGAVMTVMINRPAALNALSREVLGDLGHLLRGFVEQPPEGVRGIVLVGAGDRAFVAGADIREMAAMTPVEAAVFGRLGQEATELLEAVPVPVIACVDGYALGGGCELAMGCDFIYCTRRAVFGQPEVTLGLIPGFGGCVRLQRLVGPGRARELIYSGRQVAAAEAHRIGLVNEVFEDRSAMLGAARGTIEFIATRSPAAVAICKESINAAQGRTTQDALASELAGFEQAFTTPDSHEGTSAFLEKRTPDFSACRVPTPTARTPRSASGGPASAGSRCP